MCQRCTIVRLQVDRPADRLSPTAEAALTVAAQVFSYESRVQADGTCASLAAADQMQYAHRGGFSSRGR